MMRISTYKHLIEKEPLSSPFGFKGGYLTELWQSVVRLQSESGATGIGLGVQSILWSDSNVFLSSGEDRGNTMMSEITEFALKEAVNYDFATPIDLIDALVPVVYEYGKAITSNPSLRTTFALNALVGLDQAAWAIYGQQLQTEAFTDMIPDEYRGALTRQHSSLASIPVISYGADEAAIREMLDQGYFLLKIKIGADPDQDGDQQKMLSWDQERLSFIHRIAGDYSSDHTEDGRIKYYLDANGRYETKDTLLRFLEHADRIGALEHILLFEEPFAEEYKIDLNDVPVRLAADESVHSVEDALERIEMGFKVMTLKPVAKTMSLSLKIAKLAFERDIPCLCADLTANPIMVDWNKNLAASLVPLPGLKMGAVETNGHQNYANWNIMKRKHPRHGADWLESKHGTYQLSDTFFRCSGGALEASRYFEDVFSMR